MTWIDLIRTPEAVDSVDNSKERRVAHTAHSPTTTTIAYRRQPSRLLAGHTG